MDLLSLPHSNTEIFSTTSSKGPLSAMKPLKIDFVSDHNPVHVKIKNYLQEQREFLKKFVADLLEGSMVYINQTSSWA